MNKTNMKKKVLWGLISAVFLIFLDQWTKWLAVTHLKGQDAFVLFDGIFELRYLENRGAAFGMMQNKQIFFIIMTVFLLLIIGYIYLFRIPNEKHYFVMNFIAILFISGAIGNFIDRITQNYVVDFFYFSLINFPIFNVADIYVTVATCMLVVFGLFYYKEADFEKIFPSRKKEV